MKLQHNKSVQARHCENLAGIVRFGVVISLRKMGSIVC